MTHEDEKPQEPSKTKAFFLDKAFEAMEIADNAYSEPGAWTPVQVAEYYHKRAELWIALGSFPTEPPTPTEDGAALALLVALVAELQETIINLGSKYVHNNFPNLEEIFGKAQDYVRTQAAKGDGNAQSL